MSRIPHVDHPSPHDHPDAPLICDCGKPLAGCACGLFCAGCGTRHVAKKRWGYADLKPSTYYVPVR